MAKVSSPSDFGIGRGAGKLGPLNLPKRRSTATPETFGAGVQAVRYDPVAFGAGRKYYDYQPGKSGFQLLTETVRDVAAGFSKTAEAVNQANNEAALNQTLLTNRSAWTEQRLALEESVKEGDDPGDYAKRAQDVFAEFSKARVEGLSGSTKQAVEEDLAELGMHNFEQAAQHQAQRAREHRTKLNKITADAKQAEITSAQGVIFSDPGQMPAVVGMLHASIDKAENLADEVRAELHRDVGAMGAQALWAGKIARDEDPWAIRDALVRGDTEEIGPLEFGDRVTFIGQANSEIRSREAEQRRIAAEARAAERERLQDLKDDQRWSARDLHDNIVTTVEGLQGGRPTSPEVEKALVAAAERQMKEAVDPDLRYSIAQSLEALHAASATSETASVAAGIPLPQLQREVARRAAEPVSPDDPAGATSQLATMGKVLAEREEALRQGKTLEYAQEHSRLTPLAPVDWRDPQSAVTREQQSTKVAYLNGQPHGGGHQRLTEAEAERIAMDINDSGTTDEVLAKINGYMGRLDDTARRVWLKELKAKKLSPLVERAMEARYDRKDEQGARRIIGAMAVKPEDMPKFDTATADDIATAVNTRLNTPGSPASLSGRAYQITQQPQDQRRAAEDSEAFTRLTKNYVAMGQDPADAAAQAEKDVFGDGPTSGSEDMQYVTPPRGEDPAEFTDILERARANFTMPATNPYAQSELGNIRSNGYWRKGTGDTYELIDPTSLLRVGVFTPNQLRELARNEAYGAVPMVPP